MSDGRMWVAYEEGKEAAESHEIPWTEVELQEYVENCIATFRSSFRNGYLAGIRINQALINAARDVVPIESLESRYDDQYDDHPPAAYRESQSDMPYFDWLAREIGFEDFAEMCGDLGGMSDEEIDRYQAGKLDSAGTAA